MFWFGIIGVMLLAAVLGAWALKNSEREREELHEATQDLKRELDKALGLSRLAYWLDLHVRRLWLRRKPRRTWSAEELRAESIASIRMNMAAMGHPVDDLTDEQIEHGVEAMARAAHAAGITVAEFGEAMKRTAAAIRNT